MDSERFWQIIQESRTGAGADNPDGNMDKQIEQLTKILTRLPPEEVVDFDRHFATFMNDAYRWDLWGAAYIIGDGCSDDSFMDFRSWLISMGRDVYEKTLAEPDSLVDAADDPTVEDCFFEEFQYVAGNVYGDDMDHSLDYPTEPAGEQWEEEGDDLRCRFPKLWARFWDD